MLVSTVQWNEVEFPVLYSRFLLVICFIHISVHMSIPISQFIPPQPPLSPLGVHTFSIHFYFSRYLHLPGTFIPPYSSVFPYGITFLLHKEFPTVVVVEQISCEKFFQLLFVWKHLYFTSVFEEYYQHDGNLSCHVLGFFFFLLSTLNMTFHSIPDSMVSVKKKKKSRTNFTLSTLKVMCLLLSGCF